MSRLRVDVQDVVIVCALAGCAELAVRALTFKDLCHATDYRVSQELARAARSTSETLLVPSCTGFPEGNLIIFPDRLRPGSVVLVEESLDPNLYIDWDTVDQLPTP